MKGKEQAVRREIWRSCEHCDRMKNFRILDVNQVYRILHPHFKYDDKIHHQAIEVDLSKKIYGCTKAVSIDWGCGKDDQSMWDSGLTKPHDCKYKEVCCVGCPRLRACYDEKSYCEKLKEKGVIQQWAILGEWKTEGTKRGRNKRR